MDAGGEKGSVQELKKTYLNILIYPWGKLPGSHLPVSSNLFEQAIMIPNDVEEFQPEGERVFFRFLRSVAKPDAPYLSWYLPDTNGTKKQGISD